MKTIVIIISVLFMALGACTAPQARRPVKVTSGSFIEASVERNKKIYIEERTVFEEVMASNNAYDYVTSKSGFWYYYNVQDSLNATKTPRLGDAVTFTYDIKNLAGTVIISEEENGVQN
jgi:gliding motility-associated peptidyl-prolyl isomerase